MMLGWLWLDPLSGLDVRGANWTEGVEPREGCGGWGAELPPATRCDSFPRDLCGLGADLLLFYPYFCH